jgi:hypothetical protein
LLVAGVRWSFRGKDAGSARIERDTGATEDAVRGAGSAALRHSRRSAEPSYWSEVRWRKPAPSSVATSVSRLVTASSHSSVT